MDTMIIVLKDKVDNRFIAIEVFVTIKSVFYCLKGTSKFIKAFDIDHYESFEENKRRIINSIIKIENAFEDRFVLEDTIKV